MFSWLEQGGAEFHKMKIRYYSEDFRGVCARQNIKNGDTLLFVPDQKLMLKSMINGSKYGKQIQNYVSGLEDKTKIPIIGTEEHFLFAVFMIHEADDPESQYKEYFGSMPGGFEDFPIMYDDKLLEQLEGSFAKEYVEKIRKEGKHDYEVACKIFDGFGEKFTLERWTQMRILVCSRLFGFERQGKLDQALVPYADMLNHRKDPQTKWFFCKKRNGFVIKALEDIPRGDEICDTYGNKSNAAFFINYGFLIPENQEDLIDMAVELDPNDEGYEIKMHLYKSHTKNCLMMQTLENKQVLNNLSFMRFVLFRDEDMEDSNFDMSKMTGGSNIAPISIANELKVWNMVRDKCLSNLNKYKTTAEED